MKDFIKKFIEDNIKLIEQDMWEEVYQKAIKDLDYYTGEFTEFMLAADIHPEYYLKELPCYFLSNANIKEFVIPHIITIGDSAFQGCDSLISISIPNSVTAIKSLAFRKCTGLTSITIPDSVIEIGYGAFISCTSLTSVIIGKNVSRIGTDAFNYCSNLTNITMLNSTTIIGHDALVGCGDDLVINYPGSKEDWKKIYTPSRFQDSFTVNCIDGTIVNKER